MISFETKMDSKLFNRCLQTRLRWILFRTELFCALYGQTIF